MNVPEGGAIHCFPEGLPIPNESSGEKITLAEAFDQIDVLNKSAQIYMSARAMGFEPDGMTDAQMKEMSAAFNLPK